MDGGPCAPRCAGRIPPLPKARTLPAAGVCCASSSVLLRRVPSSRCLHLVTLRVQERGQYMIRATPARQKAAPIQSAVSGLDPSIHQPQSKDRTTKIPPYAA